MFVSVDVFMCAPVFVDVLCVRPRTQQHRTGKYVHTQKHRTGKYVDQRAHARTHTYTEVDI